MFTASEQHILADLVSTGEVTADDAAQGADHRRAEERRNYDPAATKRRAGDAAPLRTLVVDTVADAPQTIALKILEFLASRD